MNSRKKKWEGKNEVKVWRMNESQSRGKLRWRQALNRPTTADHWRRDVTLPIAEKGCVDQNVSNVYWLKSQLGSKKGQKLKKVRFFSILVCTCTWVFLDMKIFERVRRYVTHRVHTRQKADKRSNQSKKRSSWPTVTNILKHSQTREWKGRKTNRISSGFL